MSGLVGLVRHLRAQLAPADVDQRPGDVARGVARQEAQKVGDLLGVKDSLETEGSRHKGSSTHLFFMHNGKQEFGPTRLAVKAGSKCCLR